MRSIGSEEREDGNIPRLPAKQALNGEVIPSGAGFQNLEEGASLSTSLIDDSAKHLFDLMKGLNQYEDSTPKNAVELAKQLANLARVKLDYIKLMKK